MCEQIGSIQTLVADAFIRPFGDADQAPESRPDTKVIYVIQTVVNKALTKSSWSVAFSLQVKWAVQNRVAGLQSVDAVATRMMSYPAFTVSLPKCFRNEAEKS